MCPLKNETHVVNYCTFKKKKLMYELTPAKQLLDRTVTQS